MTDKQPVEGLLELSREHFAALAALRGLQEQEEDARLRTMIEMNEHTDALKDLRKMVYRLGVPRLTMMTSAGRTRAETNTPVMEVSEDYSTPTPYVR